MPMAFKNITLVLVSNVISLSWTIVTDELLDKLTLHRFFILSSAVVCFISLLCSPIELAEHNQEITFFLQLLI